MRKYDMKICSCGRIHMINMEKIDNACEVNKKSTSYLRRMWESGFNWC